MANKSTGDRMAFSLSAISGPALLAGLLTGTLAGVMPNPAIADDDSINLDLRWRYEQVSMDGFAEDAQAGTLRTRLGYSKSFTSSWSGLVEFEDVHIADFDDYNDTKNGLSQYPIVADPEDTELNRLQLTWRGDGKSATLGRQRINLRNQRFIGAVGFRQNEQTFDAVRGQFDMGSTNIDAIYLARANRIFGAHHPTNANTELDGFAIDAERKTGDVYYGVFAHGFDFSDQPAQSHRNIGARVGWVPGAWSVSGEFARQDGWRDGQLNDSLDYYLVSVGRNHDGFSWQLAQELLGGTGTAAFQTPFATLHKFNGWADVFLSTPADGLKDRWLAVDGALADFKLGFRWHEFSADTDGRDYGNELGLVVGRKVGDKANLSLTIADFQGENGYSDVQKIWLALDAHF